MRANDEASTLAPVSAGASRQVLAIAWNELVLAWRNRAVLALGLVLTALLAGTVVLGQARFDREDAQRERYQQIVGQQFTDQPDRHPHRVSHYGYLVFRPRAPLGFFDSGVERFAGTSLFLEAHRQNAPTFSAAAQGGAGDRFGELSPALVLQLLVPLFVFAVAGVSVTREREAGTLALVLCQGVPWSRVLLGKACGALLVVFVVMMPALVVSLTWMAQRASVTWSADMVARAAALAALHAGFLALCAVLAVVVSAWHATSRGALVVLVGAWFGLWIVVPRVLPAVATAVYPVPARAAFDAEVEARVMELGDSHNPDDPAFARLRAETLQRYGVSRTEELPFNYSGLVNRESETHTAAAYREHIARLHAIYARQAGLIETAGVVSPYLAVRVLSMALAGSDATHQLEFERQAEAFRYDLIQRLNGLHMQEVSAARDRYGDVVNGAPSRVRIASRFFEELPTFAYAQPSLGWALRQRARGLLAGACAVVLILAGLVWTARRRPRVA